MVLMKTGLLALTLPMLFAASCARTVPPVARPVERAKSALPCSASALKLSFDGRDGEFAGMSHDGAWLVLRNTGSQPCTVPRRPQLNFTDASGKPVELQIPMRPGMHPGPVLVPITLRPGEAASGTMRWVTGDVYDAGHCVAPANAALAVDDGNVTALFAARVCGPAGAIPQYEQAFLRLGEPTASTDTAH
jgi:hypothetical protein